MIEADDPGYVALKHAFQATLPERARLLRELAGRTPPAEGELVFNCHKLAGVAGSYGFPLLTECADLLEALIPARGYAHAAVRGGLALLGDWLEACAREGREPVAAAADPRFAALRALSNATDGSVR